MGDDQVVNALVERGGGDPWLISGVQLLAASLTSSETHLDELFDLIEHPRDQSSRIPDDALLLSP